jgi:transposase
MIDYARFCQSKPLQVHQGRTASQIATALSLDRRTGAYWLAQEHFRPGKPRQAPRKLDPFQPDIRRMLERSPDAAAQLFPRLREHSGDGSSALGKASVRTVRPRRPAACLTRAWAPGAWAQVEGGAFGAVPVGQTHRQLRFFGMVLGYRRLRYVECTVSQTMDHLLAGHQHALDFFGGIPHQVMGDNLPSAVLKRAVGEAPGRNPPYLAGATHHGCPMAPCTVGQGPEKGRVENGVGSVKQHVLAGRDMPDFSARNPAARHGLDTGAHVRLHGATREHPTVVWQTERPSWRPRPLQPFASATVSQVRASRPCRMPVETNRSAGPAQEAGHALTLQTSPARRCLSRGDQRMARQARRDDRHTAVAAPAHPTPLLEARKKARAHKLCMRFLAVSPRAEAYDLHLEARRLNPPHPVRNMVALRDIEAPEAVSRAMADAFGDAAFSAEYLATLVEQRARFTPAASALPRTRRGALLDVSLAPPALSLSHAPPPPGAHDTEEGPPHG